MELINRDDVIDAWCERVPEGDREDFLRVIRNLPTVDAITLQEMKEIMLKSLDESETLGDYYVGILTGTLKKFMSVMSGEKSEGLKELEEEE